METFIVLFNVDNGNARKQAESIENLKFGLDNVTAFNIRQEVINLTGVEENEIEVESLTDFMDRVNDEEFNADNYFISYVYGTYDF